MNSNCQKCYQNLKQIPKIWKKNISIINQMSKEILETFQNFKKFKDLNVSLRMIDVCALSEDDKN